MTETTGTVDLRTLKAMVKKAHTANVAQEKKAREARILSAEATHAVIVAEVIGADGSPWPTQGDYATALGVSKGSVTGLKRLGKAIALGVSTDDPRWNLLSSKAGTKEVGALIDADDATPDSILSGVAEVFTPDGRRNVTKVDGESGETPKKEQPKKVETPEDVLAALRSLVEVTHGFDRKGVAKVQKAMEAAVVHLRNRDKALAQKEQKEHARDVAAAAS